MDLHVAFETVTPLFLGGAQPDTCAEFRPPSLKGALRFWYRALDSNFRLGEPAAFGSTGIGQAPILLRLNNQVVGTEPWCPPAPIDEQEIQEGINGAAYLGYSLTLGHNNRRAIPAGRTLSLTATAHPRATQAEQRAWLAAFWCLTHFGGLGARVRRGLGSLRLARFDGWPEASALCPPSGTDPDAWIAGLEQGLTTLRHWYPQRPPADHPVLDHQVRVLLLRQGYGRWEHALAAAGAILQRYRLRRNPDHDDIEAYLFPTNAPTGRHLTLAPERAAFGLPLTFRFTRKVHGQDCTRTETFVGEEHDRQPSPLWIRIAKVGHQYHPLFVLLNSPFLEPGVRLKPRSGSGSVPLPRPAREILNDFLDHAVAIHPHIEIGP
jgi:CRISPR-associated protein Cmr1